MVPLTLVGPHNRPGVGPWFVAGSGLEDARPDGYMPSGTLQLDLATLTGDTLLGPLSVRITGEGQDLMNDRRRAWLQVDPLGRPWPGRM